MSNKVERAGKIPLFVASCLEKPGKCRPSGGKWWQVAWQFAGIFQIFPLPLYPKSPFLGTFRAARREKSAFRLRKQPPPPYAPKRLARLAIAEYVTNFCHIVGDCFGAVSFSRGHENGGAHPRLWRLYGVISRYTYTVQWPIISISAASYGCKGVCNITDFLHHTYGRRLSLASTSMSVGHRML